MADDDKPTGLEALAAKVDTLLKRVPAPEPAAGDMDDFRPGSAEWRIRQLLKVNQTLREELAGLAPAAQQAVEERVATVQQEAAAAVTAVQQRSHVDVALVQAGLNDEHGREALRTYWMGLPKEGRGKDPAAWWGQQVEAMAAHLADPEKVEAPAVPRTLLGYIPEAEAADKPKPKPRARGVDRTVTNDAPPDFAARVAKARAEGNWTALRALTAEADGRG